MKLDFHVENLISNRKAFGEYIFRCFYYFKEKEVEPMRDVTITFTLREKQEERLKRITEEYKNKYGLEMTEERMFTTIMLIGSFHDIDSKFKFHEWKLGLREDWK